MSTAAERLLTKRLAAAVEYIQAIESWQHHFGGELNQPLNDEIVSVIDDRRIDYDAAFAIVLSRRKDAYIAAMNQSMPTEP